MATNMRIDYKKKYPAAEGRGQETESIYVRLSHFYINHCILKKQRVFHGFLKAFCLLLPLRENAEFTQNPIICYTELTKLGDFRRWGWRFGLLTLVPVSTRMTDENNPG